MFRLALQLGCTVRELRERMDAREFSEWAAYYRLEPFGDDRRDMQLAVLAAVTANVHARRGKQHSPEDFLVCKEVKRPAMPDTAQLHVMAKALARMSGGRVITRNGNNSNTGR